jgi:peptide/nickel transport system substrate-binding protein
MWSRRSAFLAFIILAFLSVLPGFSASQTRKEVRIGVVGVPAVVDPGTAVEGPVPLIARHVFDTLVTYREGSTAIEAGLATRWSVSRDGLTWAFIVRDNVRFHDGAPLTANDVAMSFGRYLRPDGDGRQVATAAWAAMLRGMPGVIKDVRAADSRTVQIVLSQPYAPLLTVLAHSAFGITRRGSGDTAGRLIGSGPYRVVDASPGRMALEAVPGHWSGLSRAERLVFLEVGTDDHAEAEFDARALDVWFPPSPPRRAEWALSAPGLHVGYIAFQTERDPFSRKRVRQAVAAAVDPTSLAGALDRVAVPLQSFLPLGVWARREGSPLLGGTRDQVKKLLAEGGWPAGYKPTLIAVGEAPGLDMGKLAETVALMLRAVDIPVTVGTDDVVAARAALLKGSHDIALTEATVVGGDPHLFLFPLSTTEGVARGPKALNFAFYRNQRLDDVLIRASQLAFRPERQRLYHRAQAILADEMPWIPLYVRLQWAVVRPDVRGLRLHPTGLHRLDTISF